MKKSKIILVMLLATLFSSCYISRINYSNLHCIQRGMTPDEVMEILGKPSYRSIDEKGEILEFRSSEYGTAKVARIKFVNDQLVEMKSYLDSYNNNCNNPSKPTEEKEEKNSSKKDTSSRVRVTTDGKHLVQSGSIIVTPEGKHEIIVSDQGGLIITATGEHIHAF